MNTFLDKYQKHGLDLRTTKNISQANAANGGLTSALSSLYPILLPFLYDY